MFANNNNLTKSLFNKEVMLGSIQPSADFHLILNEQEVGIIKLALQRNDCRLFW